ncbi:helix-turn-helix transcriptional regulator [Sporosarcina sp. FSL K6-5500]|uniref:helix-turn-helix transcriptional regulator n=1 Tax=Sporosarcina sp. FSL K6-5500 TaxID=2921558 RepID=UPI0030FC9638
MDKALIGKRLTDLRGEQAREGVAERLGISLSALQMYENGQRIPRDEIKMKIARYYNSSVEDIFFTPLPHKSC